MLQTEQAREESLAKEFNTDIELSNHLSEIISLAERVSAYFQENIKHVRDPRLNFMYHSPHAIKKAYSIPARQHFQAIEQPFLNLT